MTALPSLAEIAGQIDHAILKPDVTRAELDAELDVVAQLKVFSVCVRPCDVVHAVAKLEDSGVETGTVIGFPHGTTSTTAKVAEAKRAVTDGASELDMVINIGWMRSGMLEEVTTEIAAVVAASAGRPVKAILETAYLDDEQIVAACKASQTAGAAFVKTSTGFADAGATVEHVRLMRASVGPQVAVKASGGVRTLDTLLALRDAGATRFGTSASAVILAELR